MTTELIHKVWHYASAEKVSHFEWIEMHTHAVGKILIDQFHLKQVYNDTSVE